MRASSRSNLNRPRDSDRKARYVLFGHRPISNGGMPSDFEKRRRSLPVTATYIGVGGNGSVKRRTSHGPIHPAAHDTHMAFMNPLGCALAPPSNGALMTTARSSSSTPGSPTAGGFGISTCKVWSGRWESNPRNQLGRLAHYHCATPAFRDRVVARRGFEPLISTLKGWRPGPTRRPGRAHRLLPTRPRSNLVVGGEGFEPPTSSMSSWRSTN